ncbi:Major Facilitator Superfamily [Teratosphaeria destructans]|uniref:Major Facilitator Superfamily n=1 Tax=Teratosphaeria destructans TaxID=418781 RepID=A0A9W7W0X5_9PEZI|nr:Major Facilitator Superfamily [Teratosphaeria destructans]
MPALPPSRTASLATTISISLNNDHAAPSEETPLLQRQASRASILWRASAVYRVLFTGFLVSLSFGVTQVPLIYVFGLMTCEEYYKRHGPLDPTHPWTPIDGLGHPACNVRWIEANTARSVALLGVSTTLFGVLNLFFTSWTMKFLGIKRALLLTVFFPAVRLVIQNIGVETGAALGIVITQCSQIITVVGGPVGYLLALNSLATEVVEPAERTATLGRLSGCAMFGTALGFLAGGLIGDVFGIIWPFRVTLAMFILCCLYVQLCLPEIRHPNVEKASSRSLASFFDPIKMFAPQRYVLAGSGRVQTQYGVLLLGIGVFLGVLATSYIAVLLQMYSTDIFGFGTSENGLLISINSLIRGLFLTFAFPIIISSGRRWLERHQRNQKARQKVRLNDDDISSIPTDPDQVTSGTQTMETPSEPTEPVKPSSNQEESFLFDLLFTKYSLILDGLLTGLATFTTKGWQMYLIAVVLPLASGTGPAAKGTIMQMCPPQQRTDALSAISLVELFARLTSTSIFGVIFAAFAQVGSPNLTFAVNAGIAVVGFVILMFATFPPEGAVRWVKDGDGSDDGLDSRPSRPLGAAGCTSTLSASTEALDSFLCIAKLFPIAMGEAEPAPAFETMALEVRALAELQFGQQVLSSRSSAPTDCSLDATTMASPSSQATGEQANPTQTRCRLLQLAAELRNNIYELAVQESDAIDVAPDVAPKRYAEPALSMTCRQIRRVHLPLFYNLNVFSFDHPRIGPRMPGFLIANMNNMKLLEFHLCPNGNYYELRFRGGTWELGARMVWGSDHVCLVNDMGHAKGQSDLERVQGQHGALIGAKEVVGWDDVIRHAFRTSGSQRSV